MITFIADNTTTIVVLSVVGVVALIALAVLLQFLRYVKSTHIPCFSYRVS